jgi:hypothetical protein
MTDEDIKFCKSLIKGRIAEIIFEMMFRHTNKFKLIHFGYELTAPELTTKEMHSAVNKVTLESILHTPDYIEIDKENKASLVEVKYRKSINPEKAKLMAEAITKNWPEAWLFIATPQGFYFDQAKSIIKENGSIHLLSNDLVDKQTQEEYLKVLNEFIRS